MIFGAIDSIAAHREEYSPRFSNTMRTARVRTSVGNLFGFFMAPFSQILEPPQSPERFRGSIQNLFKKALLSSTCCQKGANYHLS